MNLEGLEISIYLRYHAPFTCGSEAQRNSRQCARGLLADLRNNFAIAPCLHRCAKSSADCACLLRIPISAPAVISSLAIFWCPVRAATIKAVSPYTSCRFRPAPESIGSGHAAMPPYRALHSGGVMLCTL